MKHKVRQIHFVGIGGVGMSGIAEVLLNLGFRISGSDLLESTTLKKLAAAGARTHIGHAAEHISEADVVVISSAVQGNNPEVIAARERKIPVVPRAMMLAELMRFKQGIAIAGTHGKTTTTSLTASILEAAGLDPTFVIGGRLHAAGSNARLGQGEFLVAEADESDASFLLLTPVISVVTNIDTDHMDTYGQNFERLKGTFVEFLQHLPFYGRAMLCIDDPPIRAILPQVTSPVTTYGMSQDALLRAEHIQADNGKMHFDAVWQNGITKRLPITLNMPGHHNVLNALAAIAVALEVGVEEPAICRALSEFSGVGRRFQHHGQVALPSGGHFVLIDDYGHHPVEMAATLAAARGAFPDRRILLSFQPHRYTRTRDCFEDLVKVLSTVDVLLLTEVYAAGETPIVAADGRSLSRAVRVVGHVEPVFIGQLVDLPQAIMETVRDGDIVLTMGAGSIGSIPEKLVRFK